MKDTTNGFVQFKKRRIRECSSTDINFKVWPTIKIDARDKKYTRKRIEGNESAHLCKAPLPWLPTTSKLTFNFLTASHMASFGSPTSVIVSATT